MRILLRLICVDPKCNHKYPYTRKAEGDLTTEEKVGDVKIVDFGLLASRTIRELIRVVLSHCICGNLLEQP